MQRRTVNFRYGTPRKAGSDRRDKKPGPQVAAPKNHSSCLSLSLSLPRFSFFSCPWAARPGRGIGGKIVGEKRRLALKGVPQNSWDTSIGNGGEERREALVKAASLGPVIAAAARPREIAVRRKYGLMLPPFLLLSSFAKDVPRDRSISFSAFSSFFPSLSSGSFEFFARSIVPTRARLSRTAVNVEINFSGI